MTKVTTTYDNTIKTQLKSLGCWRNLLLLMAEHQVPSDPELFSTIKQIEAC